MVDKKKIVAIYFKDKKRFANCLAIGMIRGKQPFFRLNYFRSSYRNVLKAKCAQKISILEKMLCLCVCADVFPAINIFHFLLSYKFTIRRFVSIVLLFLRQREIALSLVLYSQCFLPRIFLIFLGTGKGWAAGIGERRGCVLN